MIFDTHTHAYFPGLVDRQDEILDDMHARGVRYAVQIGCDLSTSRDALHLARLYPEMYFATIGIHPSESEKETIENVSIRMAELEAIIRDGGDHIVGIGETGFDYHYPSTGGREKRIQRVFFESQIALARKLKLPIVIHSRDAMEDTFETLDTQEAQHFVLHCYGGDYSLAERYLARFPDVYFSFSGTLTYRKSDSIREVVARIPLDRILIETDAPFLAPQAVRGEVNRSGHVTYILDAVRSLRYEDAETVERVIFENSCRFYGVQSNAFR